MLIITLISCNSRQASDLQSGIDSLSIALDSCKLVAQKEEANKKLVADMYQAIFGDKKIEAADEYILEGYIQHNPMVADGRQALKDALTQWLKNTPKSKIDIKHIGADGDFVYLHTRAKAGSATVSVIDIFRIEGGKIAEHWDVIQEVPDKSANDHPMF